jgi:hypothetical protein
LTVDIAGNSKHKVGDIVDVDLKYWGIPSGDMPGITEKPHKYYSGNYLITAIKHIVTKTNYKMHVELAKDSLRSKIG